MYDVLILGQGMVGSALACRLIQQGKTVMVVSDPGMPAAADVAAGLFNPLLVKRMKKTWLADTLFPLIEPFYRALEQQTGGQGLLTHRPLLHVFETQSEQNDWMALAADPEFAPYTNVHGITSLDDAVFYNPFGVMQIEQTGWLNTAAFVAACRNYLQQQHSFLAESIDYSALSKNDDHWTYKEVKANYVICCEGNGITANPYFNYVPLGPAKGEILTIEVPGLQTDYTIHRGIFLLPLPDGSFKVGATYEWDDLSLEPTEKGREELTGKLDELLLKPYRIISQSAGIRPSSMDRRPILGQHPEQQGMYICNGFGTKAVSLLPYFSQMMTGHIFEGGRIPREVSVERMNKYRR